MLNIIVLKLRLWAGLGFERSSGLWVTKVYRWRWLRGWRLLDPEAVLEEFEGFRVEFE